LGIISLGQMGERDVICSIDRCGWYT